MTKCLIRVLLAIVLPAIAAAQNSSVPDFRVVVLGDFDADTLVEFHNRLRAYAELRRTAQRDVPPLRITDNADEITTLERRLTAQVRRLRGSSARGQIFSPRMQRQLKRLLAAKVDAATLKAIMEDGPGRFDIDVNEAYPKHEPLATMPPNLLLLLPDLPEDMEYRFVGRHLILRDVRANMIVDEIRHALSCKGCGLP